MIRSDTCPARKLVKLKYEKIRLEFDPALPSALEMKLEEIICDFGSALTAKHEHGIACNSNWKVATSRGTFSNLNNFFPCPWLTLFSQLKQKSVIDNFSER